MMVSGYSLQRQRPTHDIARAAKAVLPERVADDHHEPSRPAAASVVVGDEQPTQRRPDAECVEAPRARPDALDRPHVAVVAQIEFRIELTPGKRGAEAIRVTLDLFPDGIGPCLLARRRRINETGEPLGMVHGQYAKEETIDDRKDRGVGADTECQGADHDGGERALTAEDPERIAHVARQVIEERSMPPGANAFLDLIDAAEFHEREPPRFGGCEAVLDLVGGGHVDEGAHFVIQALLGAIAVNDPREDGRETMQEFHAPSSTLAIANDTRSHRRRCSSSCFRPLAVSA